MLRGVKVGWLGTCGQEGLEKGSNGGLICSPLAVGYGRAYSHLCYFIPSDYCHEGACEDPLAGGSDALLATPNQGQGIHAGTMHLRQEAQQLGGSPRGFLQH